jgi:hypothetical protein
MAESTVRVDAVIRLLLDKAYFPVDALGPENEGAHDAQLVDGKWYMPVWGCDTLSYVVDGVRGLASVKKQKENAYDFTLRVLTFIRRKDLHCVFYWKTNGEAAPLTFFLNCNDLIAWGAADCEDITPDNIERFEKAIGECEAIDSDDGAIIGCDLFVCRERKMRPQGAVYPEDRRFWPLFDACGPEREVGLGNPFAPGSAA